MSIPNSYKGNIPNETLSGLSPLQLTLIDYMIKGNPSPFGVNSEFLTAMKEFASSEPLSPLEFDPLTGIPGTPNLVRNISAAQGDAFILNGEQVYIIRDAVDCGDDVDRTETVAIGTLTTVFDAITLAKGTYAYYGPPVMSGSIAYGGGGRDGLGFDGRDGPCSKSLSGCYNDPSNSPDTTPDPADTSGMMSA
jgi:hypothetical protein